MIGVHGQRSIAAQGRAGVTLVEILVSTAVLAAVLSLVVLPLVLGFSFFHKTTARVDAQRATGRAMSAISQELSEAMYVFDVPPGGTQIAFVVPQAGASTPAPGKVVRFWQALRDPDLDIPKGHAPYYEHLIGPDDQEIEDRLVEPGDANPYDPSHPYYINPYYLVRSEIEDPWKRDDPWNNTDSVWGLVRATYFHSYQYEYPPGSDPPLSPRTETQPGYPWLEAVEQFPGGGEDRVTFYRERAVAITPADPSYDVPEVRFAPARISNETLAPGASRYPRDYAVYASRYTHWAGFAAPQWVGGALTWVPVAGEDEGSGIRIYRGDVLGLIYETKIDATDGSVWVCGTSDPGDDPGEAGTYNTRLYPYFRDPVGQPYAFGIDYDAGTVNFAFPATDNITADGLPTYSYSLPTVVSAAAGVVVPGSDRVTVDGELYRRVDGVPSSADEYRISGTTVEFYTLGPPGVGAAIRVQYKYRNNRDGTDITTGTATAANGSPTVTGSVTQWVGNVSPGDRFRLDADGVWYVILSVDSDIQITLTQVYAEAGGSGAYTIEVPPDMVIATYSTKRLIDVSLTVSKQDRTAPVRGARQESRQSTRVEVRNIPE